MPVSAIFRPIVDRGTLGRGIVTAALALGVLTAAGPTAQATPVAAALSATSTSSIRPAAPTTQRTTEVTLITGDRVLVAPAGPDGPSYELDPARRADGIAPGFAITHDGGDLYVVPDDVADLVPNVLDRELFNVTGLVAMRYDDRSTDALRVLVEYAGGVAPHTYIAGLIAGVSLPSIDGGAARLPRTTLTTFGAALTAAGAPALAGITHIWLDRRINSSAAPGPTTAPDARLDQNLRQIGAPTAWAAGLSGAGVTIAVVASGVDTAHPDLNGQVVAAKNFSDASSDGDVLGVGTLVGSVIAGTGAAADGRRKGVAFGAKLLSAKVIDDEGFGTVSGAIAGMEWSVAQGADIVDLAITAPATDGRDPLRAAVDRLSAQSGALFVAPAGDIFFVEPFTIASPGDAASALTVGAVDGKEAVQGFSGQGPTLEGYRAKPSLTAPGVDIIGAIPGADGAYGTLTGTTPAAAHAAGAAALILEQHPGWGRAQVASALEATAKQTPDTPVLRQGAGRLDVGAAAGSAVSAESSEVDFGIAFYPQVDALSRTVRLHNDGVAAITINLAAALVTADGTPAAKGFATVSPEQLILAPGGSKNMTVSVQPVADVSPGMYSGLVTATIAAGTVLRLPVGLYWEPERYDLTVKVLDTSGRLAANGAIEVYGKDRFTDAFFPHERLGADGIATVRVPPGYFSATSQVHSSDKSLSIVAAPEVHVTKNTTVVLDAREARPISAAVQGIQTTLTQADIYYSIGDEEGRGSTYAFFPRLDRVEAGLIRATPTTRSKHGSFALSSRWRLESAAGADGTASGTIYDLEYESAAIPEPPAYSLDPADEGAVESIDSTYRGLGTAAVLPSFRAYYSDNVGIAMATPHPLDVPTQRVEVINARPDLHWYACIYLDAAALGRVCDTDRPAQGGLHRSTTWLDAVHVAPYLLQRWDDLTLFAQIGISDGPHAGTVDSSVWADTELTLYRDGVVVGAQDADFAYFTVAPGLGTYTLEHRGTFASSSPLAATSTVARWRFTTDTPPPDGQFGNPAHFGVTIAPDVDGLGYAEPGSALRVRLRAEREGAPPSSADLNVERVWASGDSGTTWQRVHIRPGSADPDGFVTRVPAGLVAADGAVSLRIRFADADGGFVRSRTDDVIIVGR